jgi:hypothetical protein
MRAAATRGHVSLLLEWFDQAGVGPIDLYAPEASRALYSELGFVDSGAVPMYRAT